MEHLEQLARRAVDGLPTARGAVLVRDRCGRAEVVEAVAAECRRRGLEPVVEHVGNDRLRELLQTRAASELASWDVERVDSTERVSGVISLGGWPFDPDGLPPDAVDAWRSAVRRVEARLEARHVPYVVVAVPTADAAAALGRTLDDLDATVLPASALAPDALTEATRPLLAALDRHERIELHTPGCVLVGHRGARPLLVDDGVVDDVDMTLGATVSNLPAGSVYWTLVEHRTRGSVRLAGGARLDFDEQGRVVDGPYAGERVSHLGCATNPAVLGEIGWTIVDEHRAGAVFLALGENRYLGGQNPSDVNVDLLPAEPTLVAGSTVVVERGRLVAGSALG